MMYHNWSDKIPRKGVELEFWKDFLFLWDAENISRYHSEGLAIASKIVLSLENSSCLEWKCKQLWKTKGFFLAI